MADEFSHKRSKRYGKCANCDRYNTTKAWCQSCDPQKITQVWTSGNKDIDDCIKEFQLNAKKYKDVIEWIPFNRLDYVQMIGDGFSAIWLDGKRCVDGDGQNNEYTQSRMPSYKVELKTLTRSQNLLDMLREFIDDVQLNNRNFKVYGLTQNTATNEYMTVFDEFDTIRKSENGKCANCNRHNTSYAWCRTCDPQNTIQGWTSGNKNVDDCIKELQLKATKYENVIEWIPFNRLDNIQKVEEGFSANWIDGIRIISRVYGNLQECTQSRIPSYRVELHSFQNSLNFLKKFKDLVRFESDNLNVYGLTQHTTKNEYMLVFDKFGFKRHWNNGKCANCNRYNTSSAWCWTCDPQKTTQKWISGVKDIDDYIREFQLKATEYENVIEWIPFNRLDNVQKIGDKFSATWLDGKRCVDGDGLKKEHKQSRTSSYKVELKTLASSQNLLNILKEFKNHLQLESGSIFGLTQNTTTNEYMLVFDEFCSKRSRKYGTCANCDRYNTSKAWCQACDPQKTTQGWTSGNKDVDNCIKEFQLKATKYEYVIEWIPFNRLDNIQKIVDGFSATWLDGKRCVYRDGQKNDSTQPRTSPQKVELKILASSQNLLKILKEFKNYLQLDYGSRSVILNKFPNDLQLDSVSRNVYGLTQHTTTHEYMLVFDEFGSKRNVGHGKCANCNRHNTSDAWCQTCDPQKTVQGLKSGNKDIDNCIKELQLKSTKYEDVVEWIPFNRLDRIQRIDDRCLATWLDGIRYVNYNYDIEYDLNHTQSRIPTYKVELKTLTRSPKLLDMLNEFTDYVMLKNSELKVYGLTQNITTNEYMLVFDEFGSKRKQWNGKCTICNRYNTSYAWCQPCDPQEITQGWTSGNKDVDDCIKEFQLKATNYVDVIEWIPFNKLKNIQKIGDGFLATWLDGGRYVGNYIRSRKSTTKVMLKILHDSQNPLDFLDRFKDFMQSKDSIKVYGLTHDTAKNEYMLVFDEFGSKRNQNSGICVNCKRYNTAHAWCQTCDPLKTTQGWTSGDKDVDDCIKEFQLKATNYKDVIEWIPFNRLDNVQKIGNILLATWLDGIRYVSYNKEAEYGYRFTQSRIPSYEVRLQTLASSQNLVNILNEFKNHLQLESKSILGLTQNATTNEYMLVFNEFNSKRNYKNGICSNCNRFNTSPAWCQTCDPQKTALGWTSGNKNIDDCINELQLNAANYEDVIEWIPFNKLDNIQKVGEEFLAVWLDGVRLIQQIKKPTQSRNPLCRVKLKIMHESKNLLEVLCKFKDLIQSKDSDPKIYGLTQDTSTDEYILVTDFKRDLLKGICANCNRYNTSFAWCQSCDPQKTTEGWTSGNKDVDNCIKDFQLKATSYMDVIEWIPFNRLNNVQKIGEGGFGSVFSATWLDGKRSTVFTGYVGSYTPSRTPSFIVALKTLPGSQENFLREFKSYSEFRLMGSNLEVYGLTQNTTNKEYLMVFQYANQGSLHKFLSSNFRELNWKSKLKQLVDISENLNKVHKAGYIHGDFHSGNILQNQHINGDLISYITDLGLSRKKDESDSENSIYGVLPYVAPEVLYKQSYTIAADIYSFGIIMAEISTGRPPHYDLEYDEELAIQICNGLRPEFAKDTPECYTRLANQCMDANPSNRPTASYICDELSRWHEIVDNGAAKDRYQLAILRAFQSADEIIPTLLTELLICPKDKLSSKRLSFNKLSKPINSSFISPAKSTKFYDSTICSFSISDDL